MNLNDLLFQINEKIKNENGEELPPKIKALISSVLEEHSKDSIYLRWQTNDVKGQVLVSSSVVLSTKLARDILFDLDRLHDADQGVSWTTITSTADILTNYFKGTYDKKKNAWVKILLPIDDNDGDYPEDLLENLIVFYKFCESTNLINFNELLKKYLPEIS